MSKAEEALALQIKAVRLPEPVREHKFHPTRRWRFDFAFVAQKLAVEVEGGIWTGGRHTRGKGFEADLEKYGEAMILGWDVYRCSPGMIKSGYAIQVIEKLHKMKATTKCTAHKMLAGLKTS